MTGGPKEGGERRSIDPSKGRHQFFREKNFSTSVRQTTDTEKVEIGSAGGRAKNRPTNLGGNRKESKRGFYQRCSLHPSDEKGAILTKRGRVIVLHGEEKGAKYYKKNCLSQKVNAEERGRRREGKKDIVKRRVCGGAGCIEKSGPIIAGWDKR